MPRLRTRALLVCFGALACAATPSQRPQPDPVEVDDAAAGGSGGGGGRAGTGGSPSVPVDAHAPTDPPPVSPDAREPSPDASADERPPADAATDQGADRPGMTGTFRHPGVLLNQAQLTLMRDQVRAGAEPWKSGFEKARQSTYGALTWAPKPRDVVECGPGSNPNLGCSEERNDALAAYTHALLWNITGDEAHARKAIEILNAWGPVLKQHINSNGPLQAGWSGVGFSRAA